MSDSSDHLPSWQASFKTGITTHQLQPIFTPSALQRRVSRLIQSLEFLIRISNPFRLLRIRHFIHEIQPMRREGLISHQQIQELALTREIERVARSLPILLEAAELR